MPIDEGLSFSDARSYLTTGSGSAGPAFVDDAIAVVVDAVAADLLGLARLAVRLISDAFAFVVDAVAADSLREARCRCWRQPCCPYRSRAA